ncbi:sigma-54-dependent transcriptional regulator [Desulfogranum marinum]|uniref:sigma-54-dependent transcriptional regulator n=1 Tax=Desulfogranum marinum TaxID=453220 RepID=UPI001966573A|nr:sigma-54 dependent transcriptional regulator [Desulfogranum marinum]MBM9515182.1 sigma-54-dependent Fis family transcriptional regulator [Desulfogranum marinum]
MKVSTSSPSYPFLLVDDDKQVLRSLAVSLKIGGFPNIITCSDSREVERLLAEQHFEALLLDLTMPFFSGEEILELTRERYPSLPVLIITAMNEVQTAVTCLRKGAFDYLVKPIDGERLAVTLRRVIELRELRDQAQSLKNSLLGGEIRNPAAFSAIVTQNQAMLALFQYLESITSSRLPILITGETGTGKELVVKAINSLVEQPCPLVSVNVAGLDDMVFSDTLFGHVRGAFTGAETSRHGLVEQAAGGMLHLDEIGDLGRQSQVKLLRLLQEGEYFKLGSDKTMSANIRIIATTNHDLSAQQVAGHFRADLFYRLSAHHVHLPPLRRRRDDVPALISHFLAKIAEARNEKPLDCAETVLTGLKGYDFPGNIRELEMMVHDAVNRCRTGHLTVTDFTGNGDRVFPASAGHAIPGSQENAQGWIGWPAGSEQSLPTVEEATVDLIKEALRRCNNNRTKAALVLGISRQRLTRTLRK